jgi:exopolysaccharide biosynthesis protein
MLGGTRRAAGREAIQFNVDEVTKSLAPQFGQLSLKPLIADDATDIVQLRTTTPYTQTFIAIVDLRNPSVQVKIGADLQTKTLTSAFGRQNNCAVAINGEAGLSPMSWSGLGVWQGNLIMDGKSVLAERPGNPRPFIAFNQQNRATFTSASASPRQAPPDAYNVIWGRSDALLDGVVQTSDARDRQPRTAMGLSRGADRLYLLVADGRQPRYSNGLTRAEVGLLLKSFGAASAMLCDEGGSSCIYVKSLGGIVNIPSDNQGQERPTYTHFGIVLQDVHS